MGGGGGGSFEVGKGKGREGGGTIFGSVLESQINEFCNVRKTLVIKLW